MMHLENEKAAKEMSNIYIHKHLVSEIMGFGIKNLIDRGVAHDNSKLTIEELDGYIKNGDTLRKAVIGTQEYKDSLALMDEYNKMHYSRNRHHPEHFANGIDGMNLFDIVEMVADWMAVSRLKNTKVEEVIEDVLTDRFDIDNQLKKIILNTVEYIDKYTLK